MISPMVPPTVIGSRNAVELRGLGQPPSAAPPQFSDVVGRKALDDQLRLSRVFRNVGTLRIARVNGKAQDQYRKRQRDFVHVNVSPWIVSRGVV